jgi:hypothetical protein
MNYQTKQLQREPSMFVHQAPQWWVDRVARLKERKLKIESAALPAQKQTPVQPKHEQVRAVHHVVVQGQTEFHDYETFGSDEHGIIGFRQEGNLATGASGVLLLTWRQGFGGEMRVEIEVYGSLHPDGLLGINMNTRFYEGATEGTNELEDSRNFQTVVWPGQTGNFFIHLRNDEDHWATISGSVSNWRF